MDINYKSNKLKKQLTEPKHISKAFGQMARKVRQRIEELKACEDLSVMKSFPGANCHELSGKRNGQLAVNISENYRLIFEPLHDPTPLKDDGGLAWNGVNSIRILEIEDYH